jgi:hypothetical protein
VYPSTVLPLGLPQGTAAMAPVDLRPLLLAALAQPLQATLTCQQNCGNLRLLACTLVPRPGQAMVLDLGRYGNIGSVGSLLLAH